MNKTDRTVDDDQQLLRKFAEGDQSALEELARRYESLMLGLAFGMLGRDQSLACDAVQDAWVRVIRHAARFRGESSVKTWFYRITLNCCKDRLADSWKHKTTGTMNMDAKATKANAATSAEGCEERKRINAALMTLPIEKRSLLLLCYHNGMSHTEAAEVLRIPVGTLKSRLHSSMTELRRLLTDSADDVKSEVTS